MRAQLILAAGAVLSITAVAFVYWPRAATQPPGDEKRADEKRAPPAIVPVPPSPDARSMPAATQTQPASVTAQLAADMQRRSAYLIGAVERGGDCGPHSQVNVCASSATARRCQVTDEGRFSLEVPPGIYKLMGVCEQSLVEHVGFLDVAAGERLEGLVLSLREHGVIGLTLLFPPGAADEDVIVFSDPPISDPQINFVRFRAGESHNQPIAILPVGKVHLTAVGRCVGGELDAEVLPRKVHPMTMALSAHPCTEVDLGVSEVLSPLP
jgi:hypothetical protein